MENKPEDIYSYHVERSGIGLRQWIQIDVIELVQIIRSKGSQSRHFALDLYIPILQMTNRQRLPREMKVIRLLTTRAAARCSVLGDSVSSSRMSSPSRNIIIMFDTEGGVEKQARGHH